MKLIPGIATTRALVQPIARLIHFNRERRFMVGNSQGGTDQPDRARRGSLTPPCLVDRRSHSVWETFGQRQWLGREIGHNASGYFG